MTAPFKVKALFEYSSPHEDDLPFAAGQIITVTEVEDDDWYTGEFVDDAGVKREGIFPRNFVEKYEPVAPPRPTRTRTKKESEPSIVPPPPPPAAPAPDPEEAVSPRETTQPAEPEPAPEPLKHVSSAESSSAPEPAPAPVPATSPPPPVPKPELRATSPPVKAAPGASKPNGPPPVSNKPSGNAFRDRIAAFNRAAAPPIAPFKPSGLGGASFIKKPFVAPPPSRNAYVPPPREAPTAKVYRRDEDPEIKEREQENLENAERAGLAPGSSQDAEQDDQPKPMSLKERMALLQKQQQEQAQRHAEAAAKKEKPKRPVKKRVDSTDDAGEGESSLAVPPLERRDSEETAGRRSVDETQAPRAAHGRRKSSAKGLGEPNDGNEADMSGAGDTTEGQEDVTERDDSDEKSQGLPRASNSTNRAPEVEEQEEEEEEDDEDVDPEVKRKEELRARMAKMSGGMGMAGMLGMPMPGVVTPKKKKAPPPPPPERRASEAQEPVPSPGLQAPPVPSMMTLPGMSVRRSEDKSAEEAPAPAPAPVAKEADEDDAAPSQPPAPEQRPSLPSRLSMSSPPPIPGGRPAPPAVPSDPRVAPAPPIPGVKSPSAGSESDDELSEHPQQEPVTGPTAASRAPPPPPPGAPPPLSIEPGSPRSPTSMPRLGDEISPTSPTLPGASSKRASRVPPPIPTFSPTPPPATTRPPPPPPPGGLSRQSTDNRPMSPTKAVPKDESDEEEITEYEGDYDTDIASSVPHKDALKSHGRDSGIDETMSASSPTAAGPLSLPPPIPSMSAPRAPPPVPNQPPPIIENRRSVDVPRAAPPPPPPQKESSQNDDDYDPYNYSAPVQAFPTPPSQGIPISGFVPPPSQGIPIPGFMPPPPSRSPEVPNPYAPPEPPSTSPFQSPPPPPPPQLQGRAPPPAPPGRAARKSIDFGRQGPRRSVDVSRPSMDSHFVANDVDLAPQSGWWLQPNGIPPQLQGRMDVFFESEQSETAEQGRTTITRDIYVLYQDYSQTVITVVFDPQNAADVHLDQRHEPPPRTLRQDQLEQSYERFGRQIAEAVKSKKETIVGDGTPQGLVYELLKPFKDALMPVGTRAYGALVYSNLANASTTTKDEIRPGDIMSVRNAKFQGKHGAMHAKYSMEVGKPDHVAIVAEWDGTKKKVRAWEQGRESKKTKLESFKLDDLRSGEVKIWRVMPRSWVGWEGESQN